MNNTRVKLLLDLLTALSEHWPGSQFKSKRDLMNNVVRGAVTAVQASNFESLDTATE